EEHLSPGFYDITEKILLDKSNEVNVGINITEPFVSELASDQHYYGVFLVKNMDYLQLLRNVKLDTNATAPIDGELNKSGARATTDSNNDDEPSASTKRHCTGQQHKD